MIILDELAKLGIIPVVKLNNADDALPLAEALCCGNLPSMEITFRTPCAAASITAVCKKYPSMLIGAGTVLSVEQAKTAVNCGAQFIVSPGLNPEVVLWCLKNSITVIPGCATPTEIETAIGLGLNTVKFFPAEAFGGLKTLKAISAPYSGVTFMPTGGITLENLASYLDFSKVVACGGSFMVTDKLIKENNFKQITEISAKAAKIAADSKGKRNENL
ncbi:MAG: bifunctional 4-hydroxy-2-oxoglutarate aldolase/2-dehydro-3-deoxy-phosphogluconate aldolase [Clostridia bacterium]